MLRFSRRTIPTTFQFLVKPSFRHRDRYRLFATSTLPTASEPVAFPHRNDESAPEKRTWHVREDPHTSKQDPAAPPAGVDMIDVDFHFVEEPLGLPADQGYGHLQVDFGDVFEPEPSQQYKILRKLGWGMYSSVWLAKDITNDRYVAIKALTGHATRALAAGYMQELRVLQRISPELSSPVHDPSHCLSLLAYFLHSRKDVKGVHLCIVTDVMGGSVNTLLAASPTDALPVPLAKHVFRHILLGLDHMHKCGVVHTDLKPDNIMMDLGPKSTQVIDASLHNDPPRRHPPEPTWGNKTVQVAVSQQIPSPPLTDAISRSFLITDFGSAQFCDNQVLDYITTDTLRAPETILKGPWNEKVDIWTFGCLVFEFLTGRSLFTLKNKQNLQPEVNHLFLMMSMTGERFMPPQLQQSKAALEYFDPKTCLLKDWPYLHKVTYQRMMRTYETVGEADMDGAAGLMSKCLRLRPEDRASAEELLQDPWLAEV